MGDTKFQEIAYDCRKKVQRLQKRHKIETTLASMAVFG